MSANADRYVIGRERNVVRVDFGRDPDPPAPTFPGAGAMRCAFLAQPLNAFSTSTKAEVA